MHKMRLGRTGIQASRSGFGALPIQRVSPGEAERLLRLAYDNGFNFFDTARAYSDSEVKLGSALVGVRRHIYIATKTQARDKAGLLRDLEISLKHLKTDYVDILQLHNATVLPDASDPDSLYGGLCEARKRGMTRFIGVTSHRREVALEAVQSGIYDTVQFPLSSLSSVDDLAVVEACRSKDIGLIAMKALAGGLIVHVASTFAFLRQYDNVLPIWGIQREAELNEFVTLEANPPHLDATLMKVIERDRAQLAGSFCRGCGYCMPCPAGIPISMAARMSLLLRRSPYEPLLTDDWKAKMDLIAECQECGQCRERCPYGLDTPALLREMLRDYREFCREHS